jgi:hypothetical protein
MPRSGLSLEISRRRLRWRCFWVDLACLWLVRFVSLLYFVSLLKRWSEGFDNRRWGSGYFEKQRNWMMWLPYLLRAKNAFVSSDSFVASSSHETAHALDPTYYTSRQWPQEAITRPYHTTMIFSKLCLPMGAGAYHDVRPYHILALYSTYHVQSAILSSSRLIEKIKTHLSNHATTFISKLSDICLPLVYSPITSYLLPDALIRYAIRVRCSHTLIELGEHTIKLDQERNMEIASELKSMPIAIETQSANNQHFLVLAAYYY